MTTYNGWTVELEAETGRVIIGVPGKDELGNAEVTEWLFDYSTAQSLAQRIQEVSKEAESLLHPLIYPMYFMTATELEADLERVRQMDPEEFIRGTITAGGLTRILEQRLRSWTIPGTHLRVNDRLLVTPEALAWLRENPNLGHEWYADEAFQWVQVAPQADIYRVQGQILVTNPRAALVNVPIPLAEAMREAYLKRGTP
jgi:hypothetical protein